MRLKILIYRKYKNINNDILTLKENIKHLQICIDRANGLTLEEIGIKNDCTRERVRQIESKYTYILSIDIHDIEWTYSSIMKLAKDSKILPSNEAIQTYDAFLSSALEFYYLGQDKKIRRTLCKLTDDERIQLAELLNFDKDAEILKAKRWNLPKLIKALHEFAEEIGKPGLMPMQHDMRDYGRRGLGGIVGRFGGQSKVAKLAGLKYQGQMVNENGGRTYWTEERMRSFLYEVAEKEGHPNTMPSIAQCQKYAPNPVTIGSNLMRTGTGKGLTWFEVAQKYGLKYEQSSKQRLTLAFVKDFVRSLGTEIEYLTPSEVYVLFEQQGINKKFKSSSKPSSFEKLISAIQSNNLPHEAIQDWVNGEDNELVEALLSPDTASVEDAFASVGHDLSKTSRNKKYISSKDKETEEDEDYLEDMEQALPTPRVLNTLKSLNKATTLLEQTTNDKDAIDFLIAKAAGKLWTQCFHNEEAALNEAKQFKGNQYAQATRDAFLEEYTNSKQLPLPSEYDFRDSTGKLCQPKLMQKLIAYRVQKLECVLNLSGTRTGKTLSAILASRVIDAKMTVISCPNATINGWNATIKNAFPNSDIQTKTWLPIWQTDAKPRYLILNHEMFRESNSTLIESFIADNAIDFIVIDELHQVKQRDEAIESQRRKLITKLARLENKKSIARAAVDGEIPDTTQQLSPEKATGYWMGWLKRLTDESLNEIDIKEINVPIDETDTDINYK
ncbi:MAG: hypothetical protein RL344_1038 [Pseudomonadota bacterium]|jgi:hypothetical protein